MPLVEAHIRCLRDGVVLKSTLQRGPFRAGRQGERRCIEREHTKEVTVRPLARGRLGAAVPRFSEVVGSGLPLFAALCKSMHRGRNVPKKPVVPGPPWCVGVVHDHSETSRSRRLAFPSQRGRDVIAVARKTPGHICLRRKAFHRYMQRHTRTSAPQGLPTIPDARGIPESRVP